MLEYSVINYSAMKVIIDRKKTVFLFTGYRYHRDII